MEENIKFEVIKKLIQTNFKINNVKSMSRIDSISPPSVFIGSKLKYPFVNVGIISPLQKDEDAWVYDDAKFWAENDFKINDVVSLRTNLLNSRFQAKAQDSKKNTKFVNLAQEIAIASKPVDIEVELKNKLRVDKRKDRVLTPKGMYAALKNAKITSNVKVHQKIDKVMNDEIKTSKGIDLLYKNNFDEYTLSKILSVGVLGLKKDKKFVPTRWSITATDDIVGKGLLGKLRNYKWIEDYQLFFGEFMGNCYLIMMFPNVWNYELFEFYLPGSSWNSSQQIKASTDYESSFGRKSYAFNTSGGYYATRLPILEYLNKIKRQASILVIRVETPSYWASLGVWVVRESVRKALNNSFMKFASREELIESTKKIGTIKYSLDTSQVLKQSKLLEKIKTQRGLQEWI